MSMTDFNELLLVALYVEAIPARVTSAKSASNNQRFKKKTVHDAHISAWCTLSRTMCQNWNRCVIDPQVCVMGQHLKVYAHVCVDPHVRGCTQIGMHPSSKTSSDPLWPQLARARPCVGPLQPSWAWGPLFTLHLIGGRCWVFVHTNKDAQMGRHEWGHVRKCGKPRT